MRTHRGHLFKLSNRATELTLCLLVGMVALALGSQAHSQSNGKKNDTHKSIGFNLSADASEKDLGLPFYPGAKPYRGSDDESSSLNAAFQGGSDAFKLVVMKLKSSDSPDKIAAFYRKALGKYGAVLDCSKSTSAAGKNDKNEGSENNDKNGKSNTLTCEDDDRTREGYSYRSGTKNNMHVVGIEPNGKSTVISLVYVKSPEEKESKD